MPTMAASLDCVMPGFSPCLLSLLILQLLLQLLLLLLSILSLLVLPSVAAFVQRPPFITQVCCGRLHHLRGYPWPSFV